MKKIVLLLVVALIVFSCKKERSFNLHKVYVQLEYPSGSALTATAGVKVEFIGNGSVFEGLTDSQGRVEISVPSDVYNISASESRKSGANIYNYNALNTNRPIANGWKDGEVITLKLEQSKSSQLVLKEIYIGGTFTGVGTTRFTQDAYIIIYNNSEFVCTTNNLVVAAIGGNAHASNSFYGTDGKLIYENEGYIPASGGGFWYFTEPLTLQPGEEAVVALYQALDHTSVYPTSVNLANPNYYVMHDLASQFKLASYYKAPIATMPTSHYLKAVTFGTGTAWVPSINSPAIFVFEPQGITPQAIGSDANYTVQSSSKKIPVDWVLDGVESFLLNNANGKKRFLPSIDAGMVYHTNTQSYSMYRNVDVDATLAIPANSGKLVYGYNLGTVSIGGSTDPSGIDAEASIKNGARIIYKDTNNSSNDVHLRLRASLTNN